MTTAPSPPVATFRATLTMRIRPGEGPAFEAVWREIATGIARSPGFCDQSLAHRDGGDPDDEVYVVISDWVDEAHFRAFEHSAEHRENRRRLGAHRTQGWMSTGEIVARVGPGEQG